MTPMPGSPDQLSLREDVDDLMYLYKVALTDEVCNNAVDRMITLFEATCKEMTKIALREAFVRAGFQIVDDNKVAKQTALIITESEFSRLAELIKGEER